MSIAHSIYGGSVAHRIMRCAASIPMSYGKDDEPDDFSEEGTAGHELGEFCIKSGVNTSECIGLTFNNIVVDFKMADAVQLYVSYIRDLCRKYNVDPMLEKRVVMYSVRNDIFGTIDCLLIVGDWLFVIDYKHGYDVVDVVNNDQLQHYAVDALDTFKLWSTIKNVVTTIVQPNSFHVDGSIRSHNYTVDQLVNWRERFSNAITLAESGQAKPVAGDHCHHCPAFTTCHARFMHTVDLCYVNGDLSIDANIALFKELPLIRKHLDAVADKVSKYAKQGGQVDGHKLVKVTPRAECIDVEGFVKSAAFLTGRDESEFYNLKLKGKGDCTRLVANDQILIDDYFKRPESTQLKLVPLHDSKPAVSIGSAKGVFQPVTATKPSAVGVFNNV